MEYENGAVPSINYKRSFTVCNLFFPHIICCGCAGLIVELAEISISLSEGTAVWKSGRNFSRFPNFLMTMQARQRLPFS